MRRLLVVCATLVCVAGCGKDAIVRPAIVCPADTTDTQHPGEDDDD